VAGGTDPRSRRLEDMDFPDKLPGADPRPGGDQLVPAPACRAARFVGKPVGRNPDAGHQSPGLGVLWRKGHRPVPQSARVERFRDEGMKALAGTPTGRRRGSRLTWPERGLWPWARDGGCGGWQPGCGPWVPSCASGRNTCSRGGSLDGWQGLLFSLLMAFYDPITVIKVIELRRQARGLQL
jgi:hypothetical protein